MGSREDRGVVTKRYKVSFGGDERVLNSAAMMLARIHKDGKRH